MKQLKITIYYSYLSYDSYDTQSDEAMKAKRKREFDLIALKGIRTVIGCCTNKLEAIKGYLIDFEPKVSSVLNKTYLLNY